MKNPDITIENIQSIINNKGISEEDKVKNILRELVNHYSSIKTIENRDDIYRKIDGRYVKLGPEWCGWPSPGVWVVRDYGGSSSIISKDLGSPDYAILLAGLHMHKDAACSSLMNCNGKCMSASEIIDQIFKHVTDDYYARCMENVMDTLDCEVHSMNKTENI